MSRIQRFSKTLNSPLILYLKKTQQPLLLLLLLISPRFLIFPHLISSSLQSALLSLSLSEKKGNSSKEDARPGQEKQANSPSTLCGIDVLVTVVSSDGDGPSASTSSTQIIYPDQRAEVPRILARCRLAMKFKDHPDPNPNAAAAPIKKTDEDGDDDAAVLREDLRKSRINRVTQLPNSQQQPQDDGWLSLLMGMSTGKGIMGGASSV